MMGWREAITGPGVDLNYTQSTTTCNMFARCASRRGNNAAYEELNSPYSVDGSVDVAGLTSDFRDATRALPNALGSAVRSYQLAGSGVQGGMGYLRNASLMTDTTGPPSDNKSVSQELATMVLYQRYQDLLAGGQDAIDAEVGLARLVSQLNGGMLGAYDTEKYPTYDEWIVRRAAMYKNMEAGMSPTEAYEEAMGSLALAKGSPVREAMDEALKAGGAFFPDTRAPFNTNTMLKLKKTWKVNGAPPAAFRFKDNSAEAAWMPYAEAEDMRTSLADAHADALAGAQHRTERSASGTVHKSFVYPSHIVQGWFDAMDNAVMDHFVQMDQRQQIAGALGGYGSTAAEAEPHTLQDHVLSKDDPHIGEALDAVQSAAEHLAETGPDGLHVGAGFLDSVMDKAGALFGSSGPKIAAMAKSDDPSKLSDLQLAMAGMRREDAKRVAVGAQIPTPVKVPQTVATVAIGTEGLNQQPFVVGRYEGKLRDMFGSETMAASIAGEIKNKARAYFGNMMSMGTADLEARTDIFHIRPVYSSGDFREFGWLPTMDDKPLAVQGHAHGCAHGHGKQDHWKEGKGHRGKDHWKAPKKTEAAFGRASAMVAAKAPNLPRLHFNFEADPDTENFTVGHELVVTNKEGATVVNPFTSDEQFLPHGSRVFFGNKFLMHRNGNGFDRWRLATFTPGQAAGTDAMAPQQKTLMQFADLGHGRQEHFGYMFSGDARGANIGSEDRPEHRRVTVSLASFC